MGKVYHGAHPDGNDVSDLKKITFKQLTGLDPNNATQGEIFDTILKQKDKSAVEFMEEFESLAAEKLKKKKLNAKLNAAKKKLVAGEEPTKAQWAAIEQFAEEDYEAAQAWEAEVEALKAASGKDTTDAAKAAQDKLAEMKKKGGIHKEAATQAEASAAGLKVPSSAVLTQAEAYVDQMATQKVVDQAWEHGNDVSDLKKITFKQLTGVDPKKATADQIQLAIENQPEGPVEFLEKFEATAAEKLKKKKLNSKLNAAKKKLIAGKEPTKAQWDAIAEFAAEDPVAAKAWNDEWKAAKGIAPDPGTPDTTATNVPDNKEPATISDVPTSPSKPKGKPRKPIKVAAGSIPDPSKLKIQKTLGGSTGAKLAVDSDGNKWIVKRGNNVGHVRAEAQADDIYRALGYDVPDGQLFRNRRWPREGDPLPGRRQKHLATFPRPNAGRQTPS